MCGIGGIYNRSVDSEVGRELLERMVGLLRHRGPDQADTWSRGRIGFAHTRLRIIDLEGGRQPMSDEQGQVTLVYNGELWNYRELRAELSELGHAFSDQSDTRVLLHAYLEFGENFVNHLDGMFAAGIWDARHQKLILLRDKLGKKPLYYVDVGGNLVFGSEIKALFADPRVIRRLNPQGLTDLLVLRYVPAPGSMFKGVRKVPPATMIVANAEGTRQVAYWEPPVRGSTRVSDEPHELNQQVRETVRYAVQRRLMSDVPVGALLSGGVDSSIVVAEASRLADTPLKTFTASFADAPAAFDERQYARFVARAFKTEHHEIDVSEGEYLMHFRSSRGIATNP